MNQSTINTKRLSEFEEILDPETRQTILDEIKFIMKLSDTRKSSSLSVRRYHAIMDSISRLVPDRLEEIRQHFHRCMNFDPDVPYAKRNENKKERYARLKAEGMSTYIITGQRDLYYRRKAAANAIAQAQANASQKVI